MKRDGCICPSWWEKDTGDSGGGRGVIGFAKGRVPPKKAKPPLCGL